jgi:hypothetical protein
VSLSGSGAASLGLALVAGAASRPAHSGGWSAVVGMPDLGMVAAAQMGADLQRLLLVDAPGDRWPDVVAALTEAVDLILFRPPEAAGGAIVRRLTALARRGGCALAVQGPWEGAQLRLRVETAAWTGLGAGHGRLRGRRARIVADGRGVAGPSAGSWVWLPGPDGQVTTAAEQSSLGRRPQPLEVVA